MDIYGILVSYDIYFKHGFQVIADKECYRKEIVLFSQYIYLFHAKESLLFSESVVPVADLCMMNLTVNTFIKEKTGESGRF